MEVPSIEALLPHSRWVHGLARRLIAQASADDVEQEVWRTALARGSVPVGNPRGWLAKVLRRSAAHLRRGERRRVERERAAARPESEPSTLEVVERFSTQQVVAEAMLALAPPDRDLLLQRFYMDLTLREISARQGVPITTVQERVTRALGRLRGDLERRLGVRGERLALALVPLLGPPRGSPRTHPPAVVIAAIGSAAMLVALLVRTGAERPTAEPLRVAIDAPPRAGDCPPPAGVQDGMRDRLFAREPNRTTASSDAGTHSARSAVLRVQLVGAPGDYDGAEAEEPIGVVLSPAPGFLPEGGGRAALARRSVSFEGLPPGRWRVESDRGGACDVTLAPDTGEVVELELPDGPPLAGVVLDAQGEPVPFATVWLSPSSAGGDGVTRSVVDDVPGVRADASGAFRFASSGAARTIGARAPGWAPAPEMVLDGTDEIVLRLPGPGGTITGVVRDRDGAPRAGARLVLDAGGDAAHLLRTRADGAGAFRFDAVAPGQRRLLVCATGIAVSSERIGVAAGEEVELDLTPGPGFSVTGRVADEAGHPLAGALVFAARRPWTVLPDERFGTLTHSDEEGRYRLACIAPRAAWIVADAGPGRRADFLIRGHEGAELRQDFALSAGPSLAGRVLDEAGRGIEGCSVLVVVPDEWPPRRTTTSADGSFALPVDSELPHRLLIEERGVCLARETLARPGEAGLVLRLADAERPTAAFAGVAFAPAGIAPDRLDLWLVDAEGRERRLAAQVDGSGRFSVADLLPGEMRLVVTAPGSRRFERALVLAANTLTELGAFVLEPASSRKPSH